MQQPIEIYVHPTQGDDTATGTSLAPLKTLTRALQQAKSGTTIQLSRGVYSAEQGEQFPVVIPAGVILAGNLAGQGLGTLLQGSGSYQSALFGPQSVTVVLSEAAELRGVTITNPGAKGTGVWIESVAAVVSSCTLLQCSREGILVTGTANPSITTCTFQENQASGITFVRHAKGEVRNNLYRLNGFGIAVSDRAAPLIISNQIFENRCGIVLSGQATPVLRGNVLAQNSEDGLVIAGKSSPDLGQQGDPAGNQFRQNRRFDLRNSTEQAVTSSGNYLNPVRVSGSIALITPRSPVSALNSWVKANSLVNTVDTSPVPPPPHAPLDLQGHWAAALIQPLLDRQILQLAEGRFNPEANLSGAEFAAWVQAAFGQSLSLPTDALTRLQAVVTLVKVANLSGGQPSLLNAYGDRAQIPSSQVLAVATALQHQLIVVSQLGATSLNVLHPVTRAEAAAMIYQAQVAQSQATAIALPQILRPAKTQQPKALFQSQRPIVVLDPGHGGSDTGVVLQTETETGLSAAPEMPPGMSLPMGLSMSPLPAGMGTDSNLPMPSGFMPMMPEMLPEPPPEDASTTSDLQEKQIVLSIAQAVSGFLQQQGMQVILTRSDDRAVTMAERLEVVQQHQAIAFVSLHANANLENQPDVNGVETYYNPDSIEGARLAWAIHKALTRTSDIDDRGVHPATFATLRQSQTVAVQVEVGYITGSKDGASLANSAFHRYLARAIANGITRYIRQHS